MPQYIISAALLGVVTGVYTGGKRGRGGRVVGPRETEGLIKNAARVFVRSHASDISGSVPRSSVLDRLECVCVWVGAFVALFFFSGGAKIVPEETGQAGRD